MEPRRPFQPLPRSGVRLRNQLSLQFRKRKWEELSATLCILAQFAENAGQVELCLRTQALQKQVDHLQLDISDQITAEANLPLRGMLEELLSQLAHLEWINNMGLAPPQELV